MGKDGEGGGVIGREKTEGEGNWKEGEGRGKTEKEGKD